MRAAHATKGSQSNNQLDATAMEREHELRMFTKSRGGITRARYWGSRAEEEVNLGRAAMACTTVRSRVGGQNKEAGEITEATDARG